MYDGDGYIPRFRAVLFRMVPKLIYFHNTNKDSFRDILFRKLTKQKKYIK